MSRLASRVYGNGDDTSHIMAYAMMHGKEVPASVKEQRKKDVGKMKKEKKGKGGKGNAGAKTGKQGKKGQGSKGKGNGPRTWNVAAMTEGAGEGRAKASMVKVSERKNVKRQRT